MTKDKNPQEIMLANCVRPPAVSCIRLRDNEAQIGGQEKNEPKIFAVPYNSLIFLMVEMDILSKS